MKTLVQIVLTIAALAPRPAGAQEPDGDAPPRGRGTVVWITSAADARLPVDELALLFEDLDLTLVEEPITGQPSVIVALETLAVYRAVAVVWHDRDGGLQLLLTGTRDPERLSTVAGEPDEEALFVREVLRARLLGDDQFVEDLLVTVPGEVITDLPTKRKPPRRVPAPQVIHSRSGQPLNGGRLGAGYAIRAHFDKVTWGQHLLTVQAPAWRFEPGVIARFVLELGFPHQIGEHIGEQGYSWLELSSVGGLVGVAWIPQARRWFEFELGAGGGMVATFATANLYWGSEIERAEHLSGQLGFWFALSWHLTPAVAVRLHLDGTYLLGTPSFSIGGRGNFGSYAWQPGTGVDMAVALF